jgi:hypothetical protein
MNHIFSAVIAIAATVLMLLLREFILSVGKKGRSPLQRQSEGTGFAVSEVPLRQRPQAVPTKHSEQPLPEATQIEVHEFLTELRTKAGEHAAPSKSQKGPESDFVSDPQHRRLPIGDW